MSASIVMAPRIFQLWRHLKHLWTNVLKMLHQAKPFSTNLQLVETQWKLRWLRHHRRSKISSRSSLSCLRTLQTSPIISLIRYKDLYWYQSAALRSLLYCQHLCDWQCAVAVKNTFGLYKCPHDAIFTQLRRHVNAKPSINCFIVSHWHSLEKDE